MIERAFFVIQGGTRADGGVASVTEIMTRLPGTVHVVTNADTPMTASWRAAGLRVTVAPAVDWSGAAARGPASWRLFRAMRAAGRAMPASAGRIYCNDIWSTLAALPVAQVRRRRVTFFVRDTKAPTDRYGMHWRVALRSADRTLALSQEMCVDLHARAGARKDRLGYLYSIVDLDRFRPVSHTHQSVLRARWDLPPEAPIVVVPASVVEKKQQAEFISACAPFIAAAQPGVRILFVGDYDPRDGGYPARAQRAAFASGLNGAIQFTGFVPSMPDLYALADLVVLPSRNEGLARGMIEGLACGVPFVGFDVCSAREIVERHDVGRIAPLGDWDALGGAITELLARPDLRAQYAVRARSIAERLFAAESAVQRLLELEAAP